MEPGDLWQLSLLVVLLMMSAFFSASETSLMSLSKIRLRHMVEENVKGAGRVSNLLKSPSHMLGAILVGNNIVNIASSALATSIAIEVFGPVRGIGISTGVMTLLVLIFGEITPKSIAAERSEQISLKVAGPISFLVVILTPVLTAIMFITGFLIRILGGTPDKDKPFITEEELKTMVTVSHEEGVLEGDEKKMIYNVFEFGDSQAGDVMTPRTDMVMIEKSTEFAEIVEIFKNERFSRIPVYDETPDNIIGLLNVKDLIFYEMSQTEFQIEDFIREPYFTYEFKMTSELFAEMRAKHVAIAIVLDEYGGTAGMVTMEDLVEEIVGDIQDEYDEHEVSIEVIREDEYIVDGATKIDVVNEMIGLRIETEDFDSIGGFIIGEFGRLPEVGDRIEHDNAEFVVESIEKNRIEKLRILT
ncbi:putative hemolysin [Acidaminobacter hydrogenoformans DSM 2784]|uniref:Putative hemolysin n=1 Tax=Acidaminobacter hydrogenoformans DSM 2784 TaxID=1120920 RepID=A0A1G5S407_9FIRM|nr:hemolysin family protein [Acidaminobacter hydrogenoformans]SCZ80560.1 putative hemolysin [Acidaminobacter hydrogenoformans DSM 2784]